MGETGAEHTHDGAGPERQGLKYIVMVPPGEPVPFYVIGDDDKYIHAGNIRTKRGGPFIGDGLRRVDDLLLVWDSPRRLGVPLYGEVRAYSPAEVAATSAWGDYGDLLDLMDEAAPSLHVGPGSMLGA